MLNFSVKLNILFMAGLVMAGCSGIQGGFQKAMNSQKVVSSAVRSDFNRALEMNDIGKIDRLITEYPDLINPYVQNGQSINHAIEHSSEETVRHLFSKGINPDNGEFLHRAAREGRADVTRILLDLGADPDTKAGVRIESTPLHQAARAGDESVTRLLLDAGAEVNSEDTNGMTPLHVSLMSSHESAGRFYSGGKADPAEGRRVSIMLLEAGADANKGMKKTGLTPMHFAMSSTDSSVVRVMLARGGKVDSKGSRGETPLHAAAQNNCADGVRLFLAAGADPNRKDKENRTPLHYAAMGDADETVAPLISAGADQDARTKKGYTAAQFAVELVNERFLLALYQASGDGTVAQEINKIRGEEAFQKWLKEDLKQGSGGCRLCSDAGMRMCMTCGGSGKNPSGLTLHCNRCAGSGKEACTHGY